MGRLVIAWQQLTNTTDSTDTHTFNSYNTYTSTFVHLEERRVNYNRCHLSRFVRRHHSVTCIDIRWWVVSSGSQQWLCSCLLLTGVFLNAVLLGKIRRHGRISFITVWWVTSAIRLFHSFAKPWQVIKKNSVHIHITYCKWTPTEKAVCYLKKSAFITSYPQKSNLIMSNCLLQQIIKIMQWENKEISRLHYITRANYKQMFPIIHL